jgi:hypothetical protein
LDLLHGHAAAGRTASKFFAVELFPDGKLYAQKNAPFRPRLQGGQADKQTD